MTAWEVLGGGEGEELAIFGPFLRLFSGQLLSCRRNNNKKNNCSNSSGNSKRTLEMGGEGFRNGNKNVHDNNSNNRDDNIQKKKKENYNYTRQRKKFLHYLRFRCLDSICLK